MINSNFTKIPDDEQLDETIRTGIEAYIGILLDNKIIEETLIKWKQNETDSKLAIDVVNAFAERAKWCGSLIVSAEAPGLLPGVDNIRMFDEKCGTQLNKAEGFEGEHYAMVFTSKERFLQCNDTGGVIMQIVTIFSVIEEMEGFDGVIVNMGREDVVLGKDDIRVILKLFRKKIEELFEEQKENNDIIFSTKEE